MKSPYCLFSSHCYVVVKFYLGFFLILSFPFLLYSEDSIKETYLLDGYQWNQLTKAGIETESTDWIQLIKEYYVRGVYSSYCERQEYNFYMHISYKQMVKRIDMFFEDDKNSKLLIRHAIQLISMELRDEDPERIEYLKTKFREIVEPYW